MCASSMPGFGNAVLMYTAGCCSTRRAQSYWCLKHGLMVYGRPLFSPMTANATGPGGYSFPHCGQEISHPGTWSGATNSSTVASGPSARDGDGAIQTRANPPNATNTTISFRIPDPPPHNRDRG